MEFPAAWTVMSTEEAANFNAGLVDYPLQMAALLELDGGEARNFHIHLGGSKIIKTLFTADVILGKGFEGNRYIHADYVNRTYISPPPHLLAIL